MIPIPLWLGIALVILGALTWIYQLSQHAKRTLERRRAHQSLSNDIHADPPARDLPYGIQPPTPDRPYGIQPPAPNFPYGIRPQGTGDDTAPE